MKRRAWTALITASLVAAISLGCITGVAAQAAVVKAPINEELRPVYANAADVADGKRIAEATCAGCHGANGISRIQGLPHLAGQRPAYRYMELRA